MTHRTSWEVVKTLSDNTGCESANSEDDRGNLHFENFESMRVSFS